MKLVNMGCLWSWDFRGELSSAVSVETWYVGTLVSLTALVVSYVDFQTDILYTRLPEYKYRYTVHVPGRT